MTREQRDHSLDRSALRAALDSFVQNPCRLSPRQVEALLDELTGDLGVCLTPEDYQVVQANPPTNPEAFAELVANLDGLGTGDAELFLPLLRRVLETFRGVSPSSTEATSINEALAVQRPPVARRIAAARATAGLAPAELAALLGIGVESYCDLEAYDDEAFTCLSLRQLSILADALRVSARGLVSDDSELPVRAKLTPSEIVAALRGRLATTGGDVEALSERLGWDVAGALQDPATVWEDWCVDGLRDVCEMLDLEWRGLLPHLEATA